MARLFGLNTVSLLLLATMVMASTGVYASGIHKEVAGHTHVSITALGQSGSVDYVAGKTALSAKGVNVLNFPADIAEVAEPPNQHLQEQGYLQNVDHRSFMLNTGEYRDVTLIIKLNNGHTPFILHFDVANVPSQNIIIGTNIAGANQQSAMVKSGKDASNYQGGIVSTTKAVIDNDQSDIFATQAGGNCESLAKENMQSFAGLFHKLCGINQSVLKPDYIKILTSDRFTILHARLCSQVFHINVVPHDYVVDSQTIALTLTADQPAIGQCFDLVALSPKGGQV